MVPRLQLRSIGTTMLPGSRPNRWDDELEMSYEFSTARPKKVGLDGLEPTTSVLSGPRSNRLSYRPTVEGGGVCHCPII